MRFIKDTIKQLKREYGSPLTVGKVAVISQDPTTGTKESETIEFKVSRAIRLPNQIAFDFLKTIGSAKSAGVVAGSFTIIIDRDDVPENFPTIGLDYAEHSGKRLDILKVDDFEDAIILHVQQLAGAQRVGVRQSLSDLFGPTDNVTRS